MIRVLAMMGMAGGFLAISQPFRLTVVNGIGSAVNTLNQYSPLSYIALGIVLLGGAALSMHSTARPH